MSKIDSVPMSFFIGTDDPVCPINYALDYIGRMTTETAVIKVDGVDHWFFDNIATD